MLCRESRPRPKDDDDDELEEKLQTSEGKLPNPKTLKGWTNSFANIPEFTLGDRYNYVVGKEEHLPKIFVSSNVCLV